jgi:hypothetical protein
MYWQKLKRSGVSQNLGGKNKTKRRMRPPDSSGCPVPDENSAQRGQITIILLEKSSLIITILTLRRARLYRWRASRLPIVLHVLLESQQSYLRALSSEHSLLPPMLCIESRNSFKFFSCCFRSRPSMRNLSQLGTVRAMQVASEIELKAWRLTRVLALHIHCFVQVTHSTSVVTVQVSATTRLSF